MPRADFTIDIPEGVWIGDISRPVPETTFRVLSAVPGDDSGYGLLEIAGDRLDGVLDRMDESSAVRSLETVQRTDDRVVVQFETTELPILVTIQQARVPLEPPIELVDGQLTLHLTAPRARISRFGEQLDALDIPFTLDRIYRDIEASDPLTERQRELLVAAIERGYYHTPREITLTDLASALDTAPRRSARLSTGPRRP